MKLENNNHLMYCLNIHPGEHWDEILSAIQNYSLRVKNRISPHEPFALGLQLSSIAAHELYPSVKDFALFLRKHNLYVVSINGFPYGPFHGASIKENVYKPDWSSNERVSYTLYLAKILAGLMPEGEIGTISSVPCHYGKKEKPFIFNNLLSISASLAKIKKMTGKHIILALEPEPDCYLDDLESTLNFFTRLYAADKSAQEHIGVCLDTCHAIVAFESPLLWIKKLHQANIQVPKIQISAALHAAPQSCQNLQNMLLPFNDSKYLHQTRVDVRGQILKYRDLPDAIAASPHGEWLIHFHVPLTWTSENISSTVKFLENDFFIEAFLKGSKHLEVETYTFNLLPDPKPTITDSIISELEWVQKKLKACNMKPKSVNECIAIKG